MNDPITITATLAAWASSSDYSGLSAVLSAIEAGNPEAAINNIAFYGPPTREAFGDYIRVGEADVTVRLLPREQHTRLAVQMLNEKLEKLRAAYLTRQQEIMAQISKLQAIEYVEAA